MSTEKDNKLALFEGRQIRKAYHEGEWWFAVVDIVEVLTGSSIPKRYWSDLKRKLIAEGYSEVSEKIGQLKMTAPDGKQRFTDCANTETLFRIIQSIPSPKVEPLKRWLARVGKERIDEIENPELAMGRMQELYEKKGYPVEFLYREVLSKDHLLEALSFFLIRVPKRDAEEGKPAHSAFTIFPRYHQSRMVRKVVDDAVAHFSKSGDIGRKYLINHSAGSGKTLSICWLADRLDGLFKQGTNEKLVDVVFILTDRKSLDTNIRNTVQAHRDDVIYLEGAYRGQVNGEIQDAYNGLARYDELADPKYTDTGGIFDIMAVTVIETHLTAAA